MSRPCADLVEPVPPLPLLLVSLLSFLLQPVKAVLSIEMLVRLSGMMTLFSAVQSLNALAPTLFSVSGIVTLVILGLIGGNMVREGAEALLHPGDVEDEAPAARLTVGLLIFQAIATAIDAFAVGVSLRAQSVEILGASALICCTTAACCVVGLAIGRRLGRLLGDRAEVVGGLVLIGIGLRAFLS